MADLSLDDWASATPTDTPSLDEWAKPPAPETPRGAYLGPPQAPTPATWGDVGLAAASGLRTGVTAPLQALGATVATDDPAIAQYRLQREAQERALGQADIEAMTPGGQAARQGSFFAHPLIQSAEAAPGMVAAGVPAIIGGMVAGPPGAAFGAGLGFGGQMAGGATSNLAAQIETAHPDWSADQKLQLFSQYAPGLAATQFGIGAAAGAIPGVSEGLGYGVDKLAVSPLVQRALGIGEGAVTLGAAGGAGAVSEAQTGQRAGVRGPLTSDELWENVKSGMEFGAAAHAFRGGEAPPSKEEPLKKQAPNTGRMADAIQTKPPEVKPSEPEQAPQGGAQNQAKTQTGGEATVGRAKPQPGKETKPRSKGGAPPPDATATATARQAPTPETLHVEPAVEAALTPEGKPPEQPPVPAGAPGVVPESRPEGVPGQAAAPGTAPEVDPRLAQTRADMASRQAELDTASRPGYTPPAEPTSEPTPAPQPTATPTGTWDRTAATDPELARVREEMNARLAQETQQAQAARQPQTLRATGEAEDRAAEAQRVAQERAAATAKQIKQPKEEADIRPGKKGEAEVAFMKDQNRIANEVVAAHPPRTDEALAIDPTKGSGGVGARNRLMERAQKMVDAANKAKYEFKKLVKHRVDPETRHSNAGVLLHEAKLLLSKKVMTTEAARRFMNAENELLNHGEQGYRNVLKLRSETGGETAKERGKATKETAVEDIEKVGAPEVAEPSHIEEEIDERREAEKEEAEKQEPGVPREPEPKERPPVEVRGPAYTAGRAAVGFKQETVKRRTFQKPLGTMSDERHLEDADETEEPIGGQIKVTNFKNEQDYVTPTRTSTVEEEADKFPNVKRYPFRLRPLVRALMNRVLKVAGDTAVHYVSDADLARLTGSESYGGYYDPNNDLIILPEDAKSSEAAFHEAFHAATSKAIYAQPHLQEAIKMLMDEVAKAVERKIPHLTGDQLHWIGYAYTHEQEFLTVFLTNRDMMEALKKVRIPNELAQYLDLPKWRNATVYNGVIHTILRALGFGPQYHSALEAALAISEYSTWRKDPVAGMKYGDRYDQIRPSARALPVEGQESFIRRPHEIVRDIKKIDAPLVKQIGMDIGKNLTPIFMRGHLKALAGNWVQEFHGHLFKDAKGMIIDAINKAQNKVSQTNAELRQKDIDTINKGFILDRTHAREMETYNELVAKSVAYNIHADRVASKVPKNPWQAAKKWWQRDAKYQEVRDLYDKLSPEMQQRYRDEKEFYMDKQKQFAETILDSTLPLFDPPKGSTLDEVMTRAKSNALTDDDWEHYEKLGADQYLRKAFTLAGKKDVYFNSQRNGRYYITGRYEMPAGGDEKDATGADLDDKQREFDKEQDAHQYATDTHLPQTTREIHYWTDAKTGVTKKVPASFATSDPGTASKRFRVTLERQHTEATDSRADGERIRAQMDKAGVKELSGVMDKRDDATWGKINSGQQKALERKIRASSLNKTQQDDMIDRTRQMMLSGQNSFTPHLMQRRRTLGADYKTAEGLSSYSRQVNGHIARAAHRAELDDALTRLDEHEKQMSVDDPSNATRRSIVANEMRGRLHGDLLSSKSSPFLHRLMTYAFTNFLVRPSHIILHQLHPYVYSVPEIAGRYGYWKALQGQYQAQRDLGGQLHNLWEGAKDSGRMMKALKEKDIDEAVRLAHGADPIRRMIGNLKNKDERDAMLKLLESNVLHSTYDASTFEGGGMDMWNSVMRQFTNAMEANNRLTTALNAYRLEKAAHNTDAGLEYAHSVIARTHGIYSHTNIAPLFKNPLLRPAMQFRQQPANQAILLYSNAARAFSGDKEARKSLLYQLATAGALGGVGAMPTFPLKMAGLAGELLGGPAPGDYDDELHRTTASYIGATAANGLWQGLPGMMGPYGPSIGTRLGYNPDFLFGDPSSGKFPDILSYLAQNYVGATGSLFRNALDGVHYLESGDYGRAGESFFPGFLRDIVVARRLADQGVMAGKYQVKPASYADAMWQIAGFESAERARAMEGHYALKRELSYQKTDKSAIIASGNQGDMLKWNQANPKDKITRQEMQGARKPAKSVLGMKETKQNKQLLQQYEGAYQ